MPGTSGDSVEDAVRKTVTVLFCDLVGSTAFQETVDPEAARSAMGRYFDMAQRAVERHGGTVAKFIGDGVMAMFGVPEVAEDDAERAVAAGLALQHGFDDIRDHVRDRYGVDVGLRVGINTGEVVIAADDADVVGDALNTAARLEAACTPGRVLVGEDTWRLTRSRVRYQVLGEVSVKGKAEPIATFQVVEETGHDEGATPFVGRDQEMATLVATGTAAFETATARMVTVIGAPGLGKTRLANELVAAIEGARSFTLRCERAGTATFAPVADLLREVADIGSDLSGDRAGETIADWLGDSIGDADRLLPLLASFVGGGGTHSTEELFFAARRLIEIIGDGTPTVLVVDDIQWAEPLLLDLLEHLVEWVQDTGLLIVGLARPELREIRPSLAEQGRRVEEVVSLEGLDAEATAQLAAELVGADRLPQDLLARLPESTQGNPLFVRELMQMLVDDGVIAEGPGGWALTIDADAVDVPPTIQSLLSTRVERMPAHERRVVELAAVVGPDFARGAVGALADGWSPSQVDDALQRLRRKELIEPTGSYWGNEPIYRFHHVLLRDAAYRRLLKGNRAELHLRVGRWTEETASALTGEHEVSIAHHFEQAYRYRRELGLHDEQTAEAGAKAAGLLTTAARRALARDDLPAAGSLALRAIDCLDEDDPELAGLLLVANEALLSSGDVVGAIPALEKLEVLGDDDRLRQWAVCFRGQLTVLADPGLLAEAADRLEAAAERLDELDDQAGVAKARQVRALALARLGRVGECEAELDRALTAARAADDRRRVTAVLGAAPVAALWGPSPVPRAGGRCLDVIRLLRITTGSPAVEATSVRCQAVLEALRGRFDTARTMLETARETAEEVGLRRDLMETEFYSGLVELLAGEPEAAEPRLRTAYEGLGRLGIGADAGQAAAHLARSLLLQGRLDEADDMAAESDALAGQNPQTGIAARSVQAEVLAAQGHHGEAAELAEEAVAIAAATDILVDHANALAALARVRAAAGATTEAESAAAAARSLYEQKGATVEVGIEGPARPESRRVSDVAVFDTDDTDDTDSAVAELDRPVEERSSEPSTRIERLLARQSEAFAARDWAAFADTFAEHFDYQSNRSGPGFGTMSTRAELIDNMRARADLGYVELRMPVVAVRGEDLALSRLAFVTAEGIDEARLQLHELGPEGRLVRIRGFDVDDLDAATAELDRRRGSAELQNAASRWLADDLVTLNSGGIVALDRYAEDFLALDRREDSVFSESDRESYVDQLASRHDVGDVELSIEVLATRGETMAVVRGTISYGPGFATEMAVVHVTTEAGPTARFVFYDYDDLDLALLELDRLYVASMPADEARHHRSLLQVVAAVQSGNRDQAVALLTSEHLGETTYVDHTQLGLPEMSDEEMVDRLRDGSALGGQIFIRQIYRTTADLNLVEVVRQYPDGDQTIRILLQEWPLDGSVNRVHTFGPDQLDDAIALFDELDSRTAPALVENAATRHFAELDRAVRVQDWARVRDLIEEDLAFTDRRTGPMGGRRIVGRDPFVDGWERMVEVGFGSTNRVGVAVRGDDLALIRMRLESEDGIVDERLNVHETSPSGQLKSFTSFDVDDVVGALAELDAKYREKLDPERLAVYDAVLEHFAALAGRDALRARPLASDDVVVVDQQPLGHGELDRDGDLGHVRSMDGAAVLARVHRLSDEACVFSASVRGSGDVTGYVHWVCVTADGHEPRIEPFGEDELALALGRFDERHGSDERSSEPDPHVVAEIDHILGPDDPSSSAEPPPENLATRTSDLLSRLIRHGRLDGVAEHFAPDAVTADRSRLGQGHGTAQDFIAAMQTWRETWDTGQPDEGGALAVNGDHAALVEYKFGTTGDWSIDRLGVIEVDADGRVTHICFYDPADRDAAEAALAETGPTVAAPAVPRNACARLQLRIAAAIGRSEGHEPLEGLFGDGWVADDRRSRPENNMTRGQFIADLESVGSVAPAQATGEIVAVRGEALSLIRLVVTTTEGMVHERLVLDELGPDGRTTRSVLFDVDDLAVALEELDRLYATGEAARYRLVIEANAEVSSRVNRRDPAGVAPLLAPDFMQKDHRPVGWGAPDNGGVPEWSRPPSQDETVACIDSVIHAIDERTICVDRRIVRTDDGDEGQVETHYLYVAQCDRSGQWVRGGQYPLDQLPQALERFDALSASLGRDPVSRAHSLMLTNLATRTTDLLAGFEATKQAGAWLDLHSTDVACEDRRSTAPGAQPTGAAELAAKARGTSFGAGSRSSMNVAVRGGHLCLQEVLVRRDGDREESLLLTQVDERGLVCRQITFDRDAIYPAIDELERLWLQSQGEPLPIITWMFDWPRRIVGADLDYIEPFLSPDFLSTDLRAMGLVSPADQFLELLAERPKTFGLGIGFITSIIDAQEDHILASYETRTTSPGSGGEIVEFAIVYCRFVDGMLDVYDLYPLEDLQEAQLRFDAWRGERPAPTPEAEALADPSPPTSAARGGRAPTNPADRAARAAGFDLGDGRTYEVTDTLAARLDDYVLQRVEGSTGRGLILSRWTDGVRLERGQWFDEDDVQEAYWQLDEWAGASVPPELWRDHVIRRWARATQQQDWETARQLLAPDYEAEVNQLLGPQRLSGEQLVRWFERLDASSVELRVATPELHAFCEIGGVVWEEFEQVDADGFAVANGGLSVVLVRDGLMVRSVRFDNDRLEDALTLLEEAAAEAGVAESLLYMSEPARALRPARPKHAAPPPPDVEDNDLDGVIDAWHAAVDARDSARIESALTEDFVFVDRRDTLVDPLDRVEFLEREQSRARMLKRLETTRSATHATVGSGIVATIASAASQGDGLDIAWEVVAVVILDDGLLRRLEYYPADDVDRAVERLHELAGDEPKP